MAVTILWKRTKSTHKVTFSGPSSATWGIVAVIAVATGPHMFKAVESPSGTCLVLVPHQEVSIDDAMRWLNWAVSDVTLMEMSFHVEEKSDAEVFSLDLHSATPLLPRLQTLLRSITSPLSNTADLFKAIERFSAQDEPPQAICRTLLLAALVALTQRRCGVSWFSSADTIASGRASARRMEQSIRSSCVSNGVIPGCYKELTDLLSVCCGQVPSDEAQDAGEEKERLSGVQPLAASIKVEEQKSPHKRRRVSGEGR